MKDFILKLETTPARHNEPRRRRHPTAHLGNKPHFYRVLYELEETEHLVRILRVRHGRRLPPSGT
ncbi:hypothetical protein GOB94_16080 [Granulicella sp. 5B5]|nr:hypothetical protein GOB94_16080 [Granulicella sp. 5B5]